MGKEQQQAWESIKAALVERSILGFYDPAKETILACDASPKALGAVLTQVQQDGTEQVISYASQTLQPAEKNYSTAELEGLECVWTITCFHQYLWGRKFKLITDHTALTTIFGP